MALSMGDQQTDVQAILFLLTQNVEALHDNLARAYYGPACDGLFAPGDAGDALMFRSNVSCTRRKPSCETESGRRLMHVEGNVISGPWDIAS